MRNKRYFFSYSENLKIFIENRLTLDGMAATLFKYCLKNTAF